MAKLETEMKVDVTFDRESTATTARGMYELSALIRELGELILDTGVKAEAIARTLEGRIDGGDNGKK